MDTVISTNEAKITEQYNKSVMGRQDPNEPDFVPILLIFVEILCGKKFRGKIVDFV